MQPGILSYTSGERQWEEGEGNASLHRRRHRDSRSGPCGRMSLTTGSQSRDSQLPGGNRGPELPMGCGGRNPKLRQSTRSGSSHSAAGHKQQNWT